MDVVKLMDRIMVVDGGINNTLVVVKIIDSQQYCLLQLYVNMSGLPSLFVQLY
jgi:hypothetical protein